MNAGEKIDVLAVMDRATAACYAEDYSATGDDLEAAKAAIAEMLEAASAIIPSGEPEWVRYPHGHELGSLGMKRQTWERFVSALSAVRGAP